MVAKDYVAGLSEMERRLLEFRIHHTGNPDDGKYAQEKLFPFLSPGAEWLACAKVQKILLQTRIEFGSAEERHLEELVAAWDKIDPMNIHLIEQ